MELIGTFWAGVQRGGEVVEVGGRRSEGRGSEVTGWSVGGSVGGRVECQRCR